MRLFEMLGEGKDDVAIQVVGNGTDFFYWDVAIANTSWEIFECSVSSAQELEQILNCKSQSRL